jgi:hypothetical protein
MKGNGTPRKYTFARIGEEKCPFQAHLVARGGGAGVARPLSVNGVY